MSDAFTTFFRDATRTASEPDGRAPYPYQARFAGESELPHLLRAPTGAGKTATAVLGWLWRRKTRPADTPRRLVYCLPMRVLAEQSFGEATKWIAALSERGRLKEPVSVHVLMGGSDAGNWHLYPERAAVLIGTQDMLLSRALNRGYAASRFHWPIDFGLLNNDCLWVFDEPQLMAGGVSTSAQLAGLRHALKTFGLCSSVWMSATLEPTWLDTVDFRDKFPAAPLELTDADYGDARLDRRMTAAKTLGRLSAAKDAKDVAKAVLKLHDEANGAQTLVVLNTVDRAKAVYDALKSLRKTSERPKLLLVHSRFRPHERERLNAELQFKGDAAADRIVVATQVVEAGVDISARTLIIELAPWASVVQRIGRCNRTGDDGSGRAFWIDLDEVKQRMPYEAADLAFARRHLNALDGESVSPKALDDYKRAEEAKNPGEPFLRFAHRHVLRRRDLFDLFDTSPDLSGNDIDVSRYVRSDEPDTDVQVFWREVASWKPSEEEPDGRRAELCSVPVGQFREFATGLAARKLSAYVWDHIEGEWAKLDPKQVRPGLKVLLPADAGGYHSELGWTGNAQNRIEPLSSDPVHDRPEEGAGSDRNSETRKPRTIADHTAGVCKDLNAIIGAVATLLEGEQANWSDRLRTAARWHDAGKAHEVFREAMQKLNGDPPAGQHWAKSGGNGRLGYTRKHFRHELASALAALQRGLPFAVAYLIAAHHGKVRLSIRALPGEEPPRDTPEALFALGVRSGDKLPALTLEGEGWPEMELDLSPMKLGGNSWTGRALELLAELGPFRLAYLETLLRSADQRVSNAEQKGEAP